MVNKTILLFAVITLSLSAQNVEELFNSANKFYQQKQYEKSAALYEELVSEGFEGVSLFYNLGNAYYRMDRLGYAILYYEKALKLSPGDEDIIHNLKIANSATADKLSEFPPFFIFAIWEDLLGIFSLTGWIYTGYLFFIILLVSAGGYLLLRNPSYQKYSFITGIITGVLLIFSIAIIAVKFNEDVNIVKGVVVERQANVKISPDESSNDAFIVHEGLKIKLEDKVGEWVKVKLEDGKTGWLQIHEIRTI